MKKWYAGMCAVQYMEKCEKEKFPKKIFKNHKYSYSVITDSREKGVYQTNL